MARKHKVAAAAGIGGLLLTLSMFYSQIYIILIAGLDSLVSLFNVNVPIYVYGAISLLFVIAGIITIVYSWTGGKKRRR